jgi:3-methyl-2-oxobutanoate hydroxymethyltransferase
MKESYLRIRSEGMSLDLSSPWTRTGREPKGELMSNAQSRRTSISDLAAKKVKGEKWTMITTYEEMTASIFDDAGVPVLLVGDSAGNNFLGEENTIPVTLDQMIMLARAVVCGSKSAMVVADLPFGSYERSPKLALESSTRLFKEAKVHAVKLEGGKKVAPQIKKLIGAGIPVMGHLGLTPQSVHALGGFKVQGRGKDATTILNDAKALQDAGVFALVLELVPAELATLISETLEIPVIGIGAGSHCDAQVIVWTDLMGITKNPPKFAKAYRNLREEMTRGVQEWMGDVSSGRFPAEEQTFH